MPDDFEDVEPPEKPHIWQEWKAEALYRHLRAEPGQPFWGSNWYILPAIAGAILLVVWMKGEPPKRDPNLIYDRNGITIRKLD